MAVGVANCIRGIDDDRACILRGLKAIKGYDSLAHHEKVGTMGLKRRVGGEKLDAEAALPQGYPDTFYDCVVISDTSRRVRQLAVDAPAGPGAVHAPEFPRP